LTPEYTAKRLTKEREVREAERITMSISGGECTLNRPWLVQFIKELKKLNPDPEVHILVATNGSLLTHSYIDELWEAGMTDVVIGLKAWHIENFMRIAGLRDKDLAERYKETAWEAVRYICHKYKERIFLGVGLPYNEELNSITEIEAMGERLYHIDSTITVDLQNYRPEFRGKFSLAPDEEVDRVHKVLKGIGLEVVVYQTEDARIIGP
jgi:pyruvate formate lyase activating enzyme